MGFPYLSVEDGAILRQGPGIHNQLDAVAYDSEAGVVVECKASNSTRRIDGQSIINRITDHCNKVREVLNEESTKGNRRKVGGIIVLWNSAITETERERARQSHILVLDNASLEYYERLVKHIGFAARYQLLAEVFHNQGIDGLVLNVPAVKSTMGGEDVYTFAIPPAQLLKVAYVAHRARNDFGTYQRMVTASRLKKIREFIDDGGIFPTNIVVNFASDNGGRSGVRFDAGPAMQGSTSSVKLGILHLPAKYQSAWIIDGQHRLLAFSGHKWAASSSLCVTAFDGLDESKQAELFVRINSEQHKVSANHLTELFATLNWSSGNPLLQVQAIISKSLQDLRKDPVSPFFERIVLADEEKSQTRCLTLQYISTALKSPGLFVLAEQKGSVRQFGPLWTGDVDSTLTRTKGVLNTWFDTIRNGCPTMWDNGDGSGGIVATNRGVVAGISVLRHVVEYLRSRDADLALRNDRDFCDRLVPFAEIVGNYFGAMSEAELQPLRSHYGSGAPAEITWRLAAQIQSIHQDFSPIGLEKWKAERADAKVSETHSLTTSIERRIHNTVLEILKREFGDGEGGWWREIPLKIRQDAHNRREADMEVHPVEMYLNLINYREIVAAHLQLFADHLLLGKTGGKDGRTSWMVEINDIRNKASHASGSRLKMQDYEKAKEVDLWLRSNDV